MSEKYPYVAMPIYIFQLLTICTILVIATIH